MERATLKDVAAKLGLSRAAISMGLRDDPSIPAATRKRIRAACRELGYRPDALLSEMGSARWRRTKVAQGSVIAYIKCIPDGEPFWDMGLRVREQASFLGYQVEVFDHAVFGSSARLQKILRNRGITEVILGPVYDESLVIKLDWSKFITIQLLPVFPSPFHCVVRDHFNTVTLAWRRAAGHGYRRIGIILFDHENQLWDDVVRLSAVYACQNHLFPQLARLDPFLFRNDPRAREFGDWVRLNQPDVIIGFNSVHAPIFRLEFGHDTPFVSLHSSPSEGYSGVTDYTDNCAKEAINLLHYCRRSYQWGIPRERIDHVLEPTWRAGNSLPRKKD